MIATPTVVMKALEKVLTKLVATEFGDGCRAYRAYQVPTGGITVFPAIRIAEGTPQPIEKSVRMKQPVRLYLMAKDDSAVEDGNRPDIPDTVYAMQALVHNALLDAEETHGVLGGVPVTVDEDGSPEAGEDGAYVWMEVPLVLTYGRKAGES